ncbi:hypothetical protein [Methylobacterium sp. 17Sr1-1]|nr:hypothetical protein [Methylobacterium sp. 17Sr1-1]
MTGTRSTARKSRRPRARTGGALAGTKPRSGCGTPPWLSAVTRGS